jgi:hypothetical protein
MFTSGHEASEAIGTFAGGPLSHSARTHGPRCGGATAWIAQLGREATP